MRTVRSLFSLTPQVLVSETRSLLAARAVNLAELLEHLAEIDARKLYVEAAYGSTTAFLVGELGMDADSADKKILAARAVRAVPALLPAVADGRLHLSAVLMLAAVIEPGNADELIAASARRSCGEIRELLATRAAKAASDAQGPDLLAQVVANTEREQDSNPVISRNGQAVAPVLQTAAQPTPAAPTRRVIRFEVPAELADAYRDALALAAYDVAHDPVRAFEHMVAAWREKLEKRKFGGGTSRPTSRPSANPDYIPKAVRREVWQRDGGQCTYESDAGRRCECRKQLQFDHVISRALGGESTPPNLRLRCHAHNQLAAERAFGKRFMERKREAARAEQERRRAERERLLAERAEQARAEKEREAAARVEARAERERAAAADAARRAAAEELVPWLRGLGLRLGEAREVALRTPIMDGASLEERVRAALRLLGPPGGRSAA